jgi:organic radical activating enzyme
MGDFFMANDEEYIDHINNETKICSLAFTHVDYTNNGDWRLCCKGREVAKKEKYEKIEDFWNSDEAKNMRKSMIANQNNYICNVACYSNEGPGFPLSHRQRKNKFNILELGKNFLEEKIENTNTDGELSVDNINSLELRISNLCNLKCRMCSPIYSTKLNKDWNDVFSLVEATTPISDIGRLKIVQDATSQYINKPLSRLEHIEIKEILDTTKNNLERIIFTGGEPFMEPYLYDVVKQLLPNAKKINLEFVSNGTKFDNIEEFNYLFKEFKTVSILLSCDGTGDTYNYIRQGSKWEYFSDQAILLSNYNLILHFNIVVQIYNYNNITQTIDWIAKNFKDAMIKLTILEGPWYMSIYCLPKEIKEKLKKDLKEWAENIYNSNKYFDNTKMIYEEIIKLTNKIDHRQNQNFLKQFETVSDEYDLIQNVPITWRQLLPELNESLSKDSLAKHAIE